MFVIQGWSGVWLSFNLVCSAIIAHLHTDESLAKTTAPNNLMGTEIFDFFFFLISIL